MKWNEESLWTYGLSSRETMYMSLESQKEKEGWGCGREWKAYF